MSLKIQFFLTYFLFLLLPVIDSSRNYNFKVDHKSINKTIVFIVARCHFNFCLSFT